MDSFRGPSWGGSAQHGDEGQRNIFGRFGFGLPTTSINRGTAFDIISRTDGEEFKMVTVDIEIFQPLADGANRGNSHRGSTL